MNSEPRTEMSQPSRETMTGGMSGGNMPTNMNTGAGEFTAENRANMWDSIRTDTEDDLDVPPSLRDRLRNKGKE